MTIQYKTDCIMPAYGTCIHVCIINSSSSRPEQI